jgi:hypothetical protein
LANYLPDKIFSLTIKKAAANSVGLINWLRRARIGYALHHDSFVSRDKVYVGWRAVALVPCFLLGTWTTLS